MKRASIGELEISVVGLGANNFGTDFFGPGCDQAEVTRIVNAALDNGVNLIDTAEEYSITSFLGVGRSEEMLGRALANRRDEAVIATKFSNFNEADPAERGKERIVASAEASLRRLRTDRIDLFQQHQPDADTPIEEILAALDVLVQAGKVREVGCCNFTSEMLSSAADAANRTSRRPYRSCQVQYSLLERPADDVLAAVRHTNIAILAFFPLASGLLTGKYRRGQAPPATSRLGSGALVSTMLRDGLMARRPPMSEERLDTVERLRAFAAERGHTLLELAISWLVTRPEVGSVITGATRAEQIVANATSAEWELSAEDAATVDLIVAQEL
jgi:aryl-alcohol dehydrogenase-like predicted oxidoreductase